MLKGFRNLLMRGDVIVVAVGLVVALAFSNLVKAFTDDIINPLIAAAQGQVHGPGFAGNLFPVGVMAPTSISEHSSRQLSTSSSIWRSYIS